MLEEDYLSFRKHTANNAHTVTSKSSEIILPELEREINEGKNFACCARSSAHILATWYKKSFESIPAW